MDAVEGIENQSVTTSNFGETMEVLNLSHTEVALLRTSFDLLLASLGVEIDYKGNAGGWMKMVVSNFIQILSYDFSKEPGANSWGKTSSVFGNACG